MLILLLLTLMLIMLILLACNQDLDAVASTTTTLDHQVLTRPRQPSDMRKPTRPHSRLLSADSDGSEGERNGGVGRGKSPGGISLTPDIVATDADNTTPPSSSDGGDTQKSPRKDSSPSPRSASMLMRGNKPEVSRLSPSQVTKSVHATNQSR